MIITYYKTLVKWAFGGANSASTKLAMEDWIKCHQPPPEPCQHENWGQSGLTNHGTCFDCGIQFYFYNNPSDGITYYKIIEKN